MDRSLSFDLMHVIVVALETDPTFADEAGELVKLVVTLVADEVGPAQIAPRPQRLINENRHPGSSPLEGIGREPK